MVKTPFHTRKHSVDNLIDHKPVTGATGDNLVVIDPTTKLPIKDSGTSLASILGGINIQGTWDATTNTPTLASGVGVAGNGYIVSVAGSTNLDGITDWKLKDIAWFDGVASVWRKIDNTEPAHDELLKLLWSQALHVMDTDLDMNSNKVTECTAVEGPAASDAGIEAGAGFDTYSKAGDNAGVNAHEFRDSNGIVVAKVNSDGNAEFEEAYIKGDIRLKLYAQAGEPTLDADTKVAVWKDTDDSDRMWIIIRRGSGDQVKVELAAHQRLHVAEHEYGGAQAIIPANVGQYGIAELDAGGQSTSPPQDHKTSHQNGGGDEIDVVGLSGLLADDQHILDAEAVSAMGAKADGNPLHHDKPTTLPPTVIRDIDDDGGSTTSTSFVEAASFTKTFEVAKYIIYFQFHVFSDTNNRAIDAQARLGGSPGSPGSPYRQFCHNHRIAADRHSLSGFLYFNCTGAGGYNIEFDIAREAGGSYTVYMEDIEIVIMKVVV